MELDRRDFLVGLGVASGALATYGCVGKVAAAADVAEPVAVTGRLVDVHCHVFNMSDLPTERFIKLVMLHVYPRQAVKVLDIDDKDVLDSLISLATRIAGRTRTPTAMEEVRVLDRRDRPRKMNADLEANEEAVIDVIAEQVQSGAISVADDESPAGARKLRKAIFDAAEESGVAASGEKLGKAESRAIATKAYRSKFDLGVILRWLGLFTRYRYVNVKQLSDDFLRQGFHPALLCPASIDYDYWLGQYVDKSPLPEQVTVMGRLARRKSGPVVHGYLGFDPLRKAAFDVGHGGDYDPLALVRRAIEQEGYLGVKLYPPMGFRPIGNGAAECQIYPDYEVIRKLAAGGAGQDVVGCDPSPIDGSKAVGAHLDRAMSSLFDYCQGAGASIIAHANNSNGSSKGYSLRADPAYWLGVFERWPALHVTLAHFGSFSSRSAAAPAGSQLPESSWEWTLGRFLARNPQAPVFADISYLSEIGNKTDAELASYAATIRRWIADFDPECRHLLFGSDWIMLGANSMYPKYAEYVQDFFAKHVGLDQAKRDRLFYANAGGFLGLRDGDKARTRLLAFYAANQIPSDRLPRFA